MSRVVAKNISMDIAVSTVMTPNPESVKPDCTVLEALQVMHSDKFLTLPVCEEDGRVVGIVDVMDCVYASGGADVSLIFFEMQRLNKQYSLTDAYNFLPFLPYSHHIMT